MRNYTKEEKQFVAAVEQGGDFTGIRLFDDAKHMKEAIRSECGCHISASERKRYVKRLKSSGVEGGVMSKSTCYGVAKMRIERMQTQTVLIDDLNCDELAFLCSIMDKNQLSPVKDLQIRYLQDRVEKQYYDGSFGACGWFANLVMDWKKSKES